jgi:hypothetical protein
MFSSQLGRAYWLIAGASFCFYLFFFLRDRTTSKAHLASWGFLLLVSLIWPISLPSSIIHFSRRLKNSTENSTNHQPSPHLNL